MVELKSFKGIYLYPNQVNFTMGIPGLTNLITTHFKEIVPTNCLFIFFGKDKSQIKMIEINDDGIWLYQKRLKSANFILPNIGDKVVIDKKQLLAILTAIKGKKIRTIIKK